MTHTVIVLAIAAVVVLIVVAKTAIVVPQQSAYVVERLGRFSVVFHAGFHLLLPFDYVIRLDQPAVQGLSRHGDTQLYVTAGAGYWGPPMRIGARPEVTVVELRAPRS